MRNLNNRRQTDQQGFTIVELMIATMTFSVILLVITVGVLKFSNAYYKGINVSSTQNATRSIMDSITQSIQFSGGEVTSGVRTTGSGDKFLCVGDEIYYFTPGVKYDGGTPAQQNAGLVRSKLNGDCPSGSGAAPAGVFTGSEMLSKNMRVADLQLSDNGNSNYTVMVKLAYGDTDLLCSPSNANAQYKCDANGSGVSPTAQFTASDLRCRQQTGAQFCAVSSLSSTVTKRVGLN